MRLEELVKYSDQYNLGLATLIRLTCAFLLVHPKRSKEPPWENENENCFTAVAGLRGNGARKMNSNYVFFWKGKIKPLPWNNEYDCDKHVD